MLVRPLALLALFAIPLAAGHHVYNASVDRDCPVVPDVARACNLLLRNVVTLEPCDESGCFALHECVIELTGTHARASGACGGAPWTLTTEGAFVPDHGFVSAYASPGTSFIPTGECRAFDVDGSARALVLEPQFVEPRATGDLAHRHTVCV